MKKRYLFIGLVAFLLFLVARLPLSVALGTSLPSGLLASGTLWSGAIDGVSLPQVPSSRIHINGHPLGLFTLAYEADMGLNALTVQGDGRFRQSLLGGRQLNDATLSMDLSVFDLPIPLFGQFNARINHIHLDTDGNCTSADGTLSTDTLVRSSANWGWRGPDLIGPVRCTDQGLTATLSGASQGVTVGVDLTVTSDQQGHVMVTVDNPTAGLSFALLDAGFQSLSDTRLIWQSQYSMTKG